MRDRVQSWTVRQKHHSVPEAFVSNVQYSTVQACPLRILEITPKYAPYHPSCFSLKILYSWRFLRTHNTHPFRSHMNRLCTSTYLPFSLCRGVRANPSECWMINRGQGYLAVIWFGSSPTPSPPPPGRSTGDTKEDWEGDQLADGRGRTRVGEEPNHTTARKIGPL